MGRAEVTARVTASMLNQKKDALKMRQSNPSTAKIQAALKKASVQDQKAMVNLGHINGEAMNSAANELAGAKHTASEVHTGGEMMKMMIMLSLLKNLTILLQME